MRNGAVEKKMRRVISVGGRTPAPRRRRRAARRILQLRIFWVSFYRSQCDEASHRKFRIGCTSDAPQPPRAKGHRDPCAGPLMMHTNR